MKISRSNVTQVCHDLSMVRTLYGLLNIFLCIYINILLISMLKQARALQEPISGHFGQRRVGGNRRCATLLSDVSSRQAAGTAPLAVRSSSLTKPLHYQ